MTEARKAALRSEIAALTAERDQLEAAWPAHGLKPNHFRRLEDLEDRIEARTRELTELEGSDP